MHTPQEAQRKMTVDQYYQPDEVLEEQSTQNVKLIKYTQAFL